MRSGETINNYEILAPIGAGGMGEVYRARDTRLNREVAIKVLPANMAADADSLHRFQREAQMLASLSHPNIAAIHGLEIDGVTRAIVMELVEGPTLADRIAAGPIPMDEALPIARQIAEALEAAHEKGIIHRDLKPANVKVTPDGMVKVLDFGLAKALEEDRAVAQGNPASSPTLVAGRSSPGLIMGTAGYMSPEQARGGVVDKRTDIWAFGVVLYEMLTGKRLFEGETISDILAGVLKTDPDFSVLPADTPAYIRHLLQRTLERDRKKRLRDIGIFLEARMETAALPPAPARQRQWLPWAVAALCAAVAVGLALRTPKTAEARLRHFTFTPHSSEFVIRNRNVVISPNGKLMTFAASGKLWFRHLDKVEPTPIEASEGADGVIWSPDSASIIFASGGELRRVSVQGGRPVSICPVSQFRGGTWSAQTNQILFSDASKGILEVSASGGEPKPVFPRKAGGLYNPTWLSESKRIVLTGTGSLTDQQLAIASIDSKEFKILREGAWAVLAPSGHIIFQTGIRDSGLWAWALSKSFEPVGEAVPIAPRGATPSVSNDGMLVFTEGLTALPQRIMIRDRSGKEVQVQQQSPFMVSPRFSPDGTKFAASERDQGRTNIWIHDLLRGTRNRFTFGSREDYPLWTPNGKELVFLSDPGAFRRELFIQSLEGESKPVKITEGLHPGSWSPDGRWMAFTRQGNETTYDIWVIERKPDGGFGEPRNLLASQFGETNPRISPDGKFLAYVTDATGRNEIVVCSFPDGARKWQVTSIGAGSPAWNPNGKELFFVSASRVMRVATQLGESFSWSPPEEVFSGDATLATRVVGQLDVTPDGQRFLSAEGVTNGVPPTIHVVENWTELLK
ncbi:MAG: protein kinase [Acidobacteria bacterium]|nr:protein kinase [Acidobacteriota bacterium]